MKMTGARNGKCPPGRATAGRAAFGPSRSGPQSQEEFDDDHARGLNRGGRRSFEHLGLRHREYDPEGVKIQMPQGLVGDAVRT
jgi:hypothetical protein